jgi:hypothetical protein
MGDALHNQTQYELSNPGVTDQLRASHRLQHTENLLEHGPT